MMKAKEKVMPTKAAKVVELMDPKVDFVFKSLFGNEKHPRILISFLNAVFGYSDKDDGNQRITSISIENPEIDQTMVDDKYAVLDVKATLNTNEVINIEIQIRDPGSMVNRLLFYLSKMLGNQLCEGEYYNKLKRCVSIGVLNFNIIENKDFHNVFNFRNKNDNSILSNLLELHTIELKKLLKQKELDKSNLLVDWALFISNPESESSQVLQTQIPEIKEAMEVLEMLSHDKQAREVYEQRQKSLRDKLSSLNHEREVGMKKGIQKGIQKGKRTAQQEIALEMLLDGDSIEKVVRCTHLSLNEVKKLQKKDSH